MPKSTKATEGYFEKKHQVLQDAVEKHLNAVQENVRTARAKKTELLQRKAKLIKHAQVRKLFLKLTKPIDMEKAVNAINEGTKMSGNPETVEGRGQQWAQQYEENLAEMLRLVDDALVNIGKLIKKKEDEEKKILEISRKAEEFHNSCLEKVKELKSEGQKPFQISSSDGPGSDYLYNNTPFQCYQ